MLPLTILFVIMECPSHLVRLHNASEILIWVNLIELNVAGLRPHLADQVCPLVRQFEYSAEVLSKKLLLVHAILFPVLLVTTLPVFDRPVTLSHLGSLKGLHLAQLSELVDVEDVDVLSVLVAMACDLIWVEVVLSFESARH